jgi:predicted MFS family arabinose efflux permease
MLSAAIGAGIGGLLVATYGFQGLFISMAAMQFAAAAVSFKYLYTAN